MQHQIRDLEEEVRREDTRVAARKAAGLAHRRGLANDGTALDGVAAFNPLYGELKSKLSENRRQAAASDLAHQHQPRRCSSRNWRAAATSPHRKARWPS